MGIEWQRFEQFQYIVEQRCTTRHRHSLYKTHTALLGPIIDSCHVSIVLVKRFCKFVDSMLTSDNKIVKVIITKAIASAQSPIGMNIAIL